MANKRFWLGMLAMVLVFGMVVVGCGDDDDESDSYNPDNGGGDLYNPGNGGDNNLGGANQGGTKPSTPQGVSLQPYSKPGAMGKTDVYYTITWNAVTSAQSYNIYKAISYSGPYTKNNISPITLTTWGNFYGTYGESLTSWPNNYFKITAVNSHGESEQSAIVSITRSAIGGY